MRLVGIRPQVKHQEDANTDGVQYVSLPPERELARCRCGEVVLKRAFGKVIIIGKGTVHLLYTGTTPTIKQRCQKCNEWFLMENPFDTVQNQANTNPN